MTPPCLQFFAVVEYLLVSSVPALIVCTILAANAQTLATVNGSFGGLLVLMFAENAINGVGYKLKRSTDGYVFNLMRILYVFFNWIQLIMLRDIAVGTWLENMLVAKICVAIFFTGVSVFVQMAYSPDHMKEYRALMCRLYQFVDKNQEEEKEEEDEAEEDDEAKEEEEAEQESKDD